MQCQFCKEEIQDGAIKCKHCGSMLNSAPSQQQQVNSGTQQQATNIDNLGVSDVWKTRFRAFQEHGQAESSWYGYKFNSNNPVLAIKGGAVFNENNYVSWCALMFGALWYFVKGMWKKGIVLGIVSIICGIIGKKLAAHSYMLAMLLPVQLQHIVGAMTTINLKCLNSHLGGERSTWPILLMKLLCWSQVCNTWPVSRSKLAAWYHASVSWWLP